MGWIGQSAVVIARSRDEFKREEAAAQFVLRVPDFLFSWRIFQSRRQTRKWKSVDPVLVIVIVLVIDARTRLPRGLTS